MTEHDRLLKIMPCRPEDYEPWGNVERERPDCSSGCKFARWLEGEIQFDWCVCTNPASHRVGLPRTSQSISECTLSGRVPVAAACNISRTEHAQNASPTWTDSTQGAIVIQSQTDVGASCRKRLRGSRSTTSISSGWNATSAGPRNR